MEIINTDVCIVGAGPAGATTATTLGKLGVMHTLVDAASFPRDKVCGDGLDLKVVRVLNNIDPSIINEFQRPLFQQSKGIRFVLPNGKQVNLINDVDNTFSNKPVFYISKRWHFDDFLLSKLDKNFTDLHLKTRIIHIERVNNQWKLLAKNGDKQLTIYANMLVGADGDHSIVLKHIADKKINRFHYAAAVRQYWQNVDGIESDKLIEVYFPKQHPYSYFWMFPLDNNEVNVGYGMASHYAAKRNINMRDMLAHIIKTDAYISPRFKNAVASGETKGWGLPMSSLQRKAHGDGCLLVGDAASMICPTSGDGIGTGMMSGYIAAHFIQRAVLQQNFSGVMFANYDREIHKRIRTEERLYNIANKLPPALFNSFVNMTLGSNWFKKRFIKKEIQHWLETAWQKPIDIKF